MNRTRLHVRGWRDRFQALRRHWRDPGRRMVRGNRYGEGDGGRRAGAQVCETAWVT